MNPIQINENHTDVSCFGNSNGSIDLNVTGGTTPYSYSWSNGQSSEDINNLTAGNYQVSISDFNNCQSQLLITINQPAATLNVSETQQNVLCFGQSTGSVNLTISGGTAPYSYIWSNGQLTEDVFNLSAGNYNVQITDASGCSVNTSITITEPSTALTISEIHQDAICAQSQTGSINLTVSGGTAPYFYEWSNGNTNQDISNLAEGIYTVTVTDGNGCVQTLSITINDPSNSLTLNETHTDVSCFGGANGSIDLSIIDTEPITSIIWSNGSSSEDIAGLSAGNYFVQVTNLLGCSSFLAIQINQPNDVISQTNLVNNVICFGQSNGSINLTISGGTQPYSFLWSNGSTNEDIGGLTAGNYSVVISDSKNCSFTTDFTITEPTNPISASVVTTNVNCFGGNNGEINLSVSGGVPPYTYSWSNGSTTEDINTLIANQYTVVIQDANGCNFSLVNNVIQPNNGIQITANIENVNCFGGNNGSINISVTGGTPNYSYLWSTGFTNQDPINLTSGNYSVQVTDLNGCSQIQSYQIIQPQSALSVSLITTDVLCHNGATGTASAIVSGGSSPYIFSWSNGENTSAIDSLLAGNINLIVTDINGCQSNLNGFISQPAPLVAQTTNTNLLCYGQSSGSISITVTGGITPYSYLWNTGATQTFVNNLPAGPYFVTVSDGNNCSTTFSDTIFQPTSQIQISSIVTDNICFGENNGIIDVTISGGTSPYVSQWNTGAFSEDLFNVLAGQYIITVIDNNGCISSQSIIVNQPTTPLSVSADILPVSCFGGNDGSINVSVSGTDAPYSYSWGNGSTDEDLINLLSGTYNLTVTNVNGCLTEASFLVEQPAQLSFVTSISPVSCFGGNNGSINLSVLGGTLPYTYSWENGNTTQDILNVSADIYTVLVTDNKGCSEIDSFLVAQPTVLELNAILTSPNCFANTNGSIDITVIGGIEDYQYQWSNGEITEDINNVNANAYSLVVTDNNGCIIDTTFNLSQPPNAVTISLSSEIVSCFNGNDGAIDLSINGGSAPYSVTWSNGQITEDIQNLVGGNYSVNVTDANGCSVTGSIIINTPSAPLSVTGITQDVACFNGTNGSIDLTITGGTSPYSVQWNNGSVNQDLLNIIAGDYSVVVTDAGGCTTTNSFVIQQPASAINLTYNVTNVSCFGGNNGIILCNVNGGLPPYNYSWSNGSNQEDLVGISAGSYQITISDATGCSISETIQVIQPSDTIQISAIVNNVSCNGLSDGSLNISVSGGSPGYSYNWSNSAITEDIQNLQIGSYTVTVTDANSCLFDSTFTITEPTTLQASSQNTNILCYGNSTGAINLTISGGFPPYNFLWSNGSNSEDISSLLAGNYFVDITDANGCTYTYSTSLTQPIDPIVISEIHQNVLCFGANNGSIDLTITGGTPNYSYSWNTGATTQDLSTLIAGDYTVNVTDANNCVASLVVNVEQPGAPLTLSSNITNVLCFGLASGSIDITVNGGSAPFTYFWNTGAISQDLINVPAGQYTLAVTDVNNCVSSTIFTLSQPENALTVNVNSTADVSCFGYSDGSALISITGGTPAYNILWNTGATSSFIENLTAGQYSVTVTDEFGCENITNIQIGEPAEIIPSFDYQINGICSPVSVEFSNTSQGNPTNCIWQFGNGETLNNCSSFNYTYNVPGCYSVTLITNLGNGCVANLTLDSIICVQSGPTASFTVVQSEDVYITGNVQFNNGSVNSDSYVWDFGDNSPLSDIENPTHNYGGMSSNTYEVILVAQDSLGCTDTAIVSFSIEEDFLVFIPNTFTIDDNNTNEIFLPIFSNSEDLRKYELLIYDRWGELIWETTDKFTGWDGMSRGKKCQDGIYSWKITYVRQNYDKQILVGHVSLFR